MQRHLVVSSRNHIHRFHDIDFAIVRPVRGICEPECWPGAAANRAVDHVEDEEGVEAVLVFGGDTDGEAAG